MARDVQAVAGIALIILHRGVLVSALEVDTVVTLDTVERQCAAGGSYQKQECKDNMHETFIYHGVLSS
ncbi:MAG: hypothetical protein LC645_04265 [Geobacteraceae bacterium]|nr:hypothetical protein [Geobacteraceae bacterium]